MKYIFYELASIMICFYHFSNCDTIGELTQSMVYLFLCFCLGYGLSAMLAQFHSMPMHAAVHSSKVELFCERLSHPKSKSKPKPEPNVDFLHHRFRSHFAGPAVLLLLFVGVSCGCISFEILFYFLLK